jgi:hypothetical protein
MNKKDYWKNSHLGLSFAPYCIAHFIVPTSLGILNKICRKEKNNWKFTLLSSSWFKSCEYL